MYKAIYRALHLRDLIAGMALHFKLGLVEIERHGLVWQAIFFALGWVGAILWTKWYLGIPGYSMYAAQQALEICSGG